MKMWSAFGIKDHFYQQLLGQATDDRKPAHTCTRGNILYSILRCLQLQHSPVGLMQPDRWLCVYLGESARKMSTLLRSKSVKWNCEHGVTNTNQIKWRYLKHSCTRPNSTCVLTQILIRPAWFKFLAKFLVPVSLQPHVLPHSSHCHGLLHVCPSLAGSDAVRVKVAWAASWQAWLCTLAVPVVGMEALCPLPLPRQVHSDWGRERSRTESFFLLLVPVFCCLWSVFCLCKVRSLCSDVCNVRWHPGTWMLAQAVI